MREVSNPLLYGKIIIIITVFFALFHFLVIVGKIPDNIVWGGRMSGNKKLILMESVSLIFIILAGLCGYFSALSISRGNSSVFLKILTWGFAVIFLLNTVGNAFAETNFEKFAFTPITIILAYMFIRLGLG